MESALQRYAGVIGKTTALTCLDLNGRPTQVLSYAKLLQVSLSPLRVRFPLLSKDYRLSDCFLGPPFLQRANRIAFLLLNKLGQRGELSLKPRARVALVYTSNDPISFLVAFYGCLLASVVPIAVEVPNTAASGKKVRFPILWITFQLTFLY